jgi:hypothetical protein
MTSGIRAFQEDSGGRSAPGYVIHAGDLRLPLAPGITALPFSEL